MSKTHKKRTNIILLLIILIIITTLISFLILNYFKSYKVVVIQTKTGKLIGTVVNRFGKRVHSYFGVPYAEPPTGELRFRKPEPKKPWNGTFRAVKSGHQCWQKPVVYNELDKVMQKLLKSVPDWSHFTGEQMSEDCLHLNIFVPDTNIQEPNMTVMVWIHGGAFILGSINVPLYDGSILAAKKDMIVVALNYRLGVFGFLNAKDTELVGNYGLYDQVLALQWIRDNIHSFGGNPNNMVLFGESAGAISIGYHLLSPLSQPLFSRAILQSGNPVLPMMLLSKETQTKATLEVVRLSGCPFIKQSSDNLTDTLNDESIECLRHKNASILFESSESVISKGVGAFLPIEGNDFFAEHPLDLVKKRIFFTQKEILIGTNEVEGARFVNFGPFQKYWSNDKIDSNFTKDKMIEILNSSLPNEYKIYSKFIINIALENLQDDTDSAQVWNRFVKIVGDAIFVCSDYLFINEYSQSNRTVYYYQFKPKPSFLSWGPHWAEGAVHGEEIAFVFGLPLLLQKNYTFEEIQLSEKIQTAWTNFAKTGKPTSRDEIWEPYRYDEPLFLSFDLKDSYMNNGFPGYKCDLYYEDMLSYARKFFKTYNGTQPF